MPRKIFKIESHEQALDVWRKEKVRNAKLLHIDFHCDLRGLLIHRKAQRAYKIWNRFPHVDEGNFLKHAIIEGMISGIRWVHDEPGGRRDDIKSVKFETDISASFHRLLLAVQREQGIPIEFQVMKTEEWIDIKPGEILDIDWDFFAANEYPVDSIQQRVSDFLSRDLHQVPDQTIVCYSPEYSHSTRGLFNNFVADLAKRFSAEVVEVPQPDRAKPVPRLKSVLRPVYQPTRDIYHSACLALRRCGIY